MVAKLKTHLNRSREMLTEISAIVSSLNTARQIGTAILELKQAEAIRDKVYELKDKIGDAQDGLFRVGQERSELAEKVRELEARIAEFKQWEKEKSRYQLCALTPDRMAMKLRKEKADGEPDHMLCANCFAARKKRYLMSTSFNDNFCQLKCHSCGQEISYYRNGRGVFEYEPAGDWKTL